MKIVCKYKFQWSSAFRLLASEKTKKKREYRIASNMGERKKGEQRHQRGTEILITFEQFHRTGGETKKISRISSPPTYTVGKELTTNIRSCDRQHAIYCAQ